MVRAGGLLHTSRNAGLVVFAGRAPAARASEPWLRGTIPRLIQVLVHSSDAGGSDETKTTKSSSNLGGHTQIQHGRPGKTAIRLPARRSLACSRPQVSASVLPSAMPPDDDLTTATRSLHGETPVDVGPSRRVGRGQCRRRRVLNPLRLRPLPNLFLGPPSRWRGLTW